MGKDFVDEKQILECFPWKDQESTGVVHDGVRASWCIVDECHFPERFPRSQDCDRFLASGNMTRDANFSFEYEVKLVPNFTLLENEFVPMVVFLVRDDRELSK